ncbi:MAG: hypothetical protein B6I35_09860 [Anaerolineaceae bacterium 4572_32.2]|nr:MAG: hypothetical protein B6I35_09860 [Anaerolineaceae bacterium 4572_32.2]
MTERDRFTFDSALWFQWIMATTLGWLLGYLIFPNLPAISAGVGVGVLQWPILYRRISRAWRWPLITALAWLAGSILLVVTTPAGLQFLLSGLFLGPIVGLAQWLILRREVRWAGWWIIISAIAWITGLTLVPGILATGAMVGAISGIALELLLRCPSPARPEPDGAD